MPQWLVQAFDNSWLTPHGFCLLWEPGLLALQSVCDILIALSYYSIPIALIVFARRRKDLAFPWVFTLFAAFILACGTTHVFGALTLWVPAYWAEGVVKTITATLSLATAALLWPLMPRVLALPSTVDLRRANVALEREIDDRRRAELALRRSEERFRAAMLHSGIGMAIVAEDGALLEVNQELARITGFSHDELTGRRVQDLTDPEDWAQERPQMHRLFHGEIESYRLEKRLRRHDGTPTWTQLTASLARDADGRPRHLIAQLEDIQQRKDAERALRESEERLRVAEKLSALGQLAGGIAHDFNNVLQAVQGAASLVRRHAGNTETVAQLAGLMEEAVRRGGAVTGRLLAFAGKDKLQLEAVAIPALLENLRFFLSHTLGASIAVATDCPAAIPPIAADRSQLETVLINLATNARDAMPEGGQLTIGASIETGVAGLPPAAYVRLSVRDTGTGMTPETLARATEPFFTTKRHGKGTGLGLALARDFCEQSGGALAIASAPGAGTTIDLWFRVAAGAAPALASDSAPSDAAPSDAAPSAAAPSAAAQAGSGPAAAGRPLHCLVVDDEPTVREVMASELRALGFAVESAADGPAALDRLRLATSVDVLITDLSMPGMDGLALIRAAQSMRPGLSALLLTGFPGAAASAETQSESGTFTVLRKPVRAADLADRIRQLVATCAHT